jgi:hypothetical protein
VNRFLTLSVAFGAIHEHDELRPHGHHFVIEATIPWSEAAANPTAGLRQALDAISAELDFTNLGQMLPGAAYSVTGLAAHFYERLASIYRNLERVTVWAGDEGIGTAERSRL